MESCWCWYGAEKKWLIFSMKPIKTFTQGLSSFYPSFWPWQYPLPSERSFSAMRRIKNYLRTTMRDERLSNLSLLHVYCHCGSNWSIHCIEKQKNEIYLKHIYQNKTVVSCRILQISIIWSFTNIDRVFGQWVISLIIKNYGIA